VPVRVVGVQRGDLQLQLRRLVRSYQPIL
jgi:hypothetical protein